LLTTRETVLALTPARWATSRMVAIARPSSFGQRPVCHRCQTEMGVFYDTGDIETNVAYCPAQASCSVTQVTHKETPEE
jgi:hypothetical protein